MLAPWKKGYDQLRQHIKKQRHYFGNKGPSSKGYGFSSGHVWMWELDYKENWAPKNWCFWTVVLEKTIESHFDCKEVQPVHPKGNQSWVFFGRTDVEAETPILWSPDAKNWLIVTACGEWCWICVLRRRFNFETRDQAWSLESLCIGVLLKWKRTEQASDIDIRRGMESAPLASL